MEITTRDIRISFYELGRILEKLNNTVLSVNEKYGEETGKLFEAGFWDTLKSGAGKVGSAIGKSAGVVKNVATTAYNKGKELGQDALNVIKEIGSKIEGWVSQAWQFVMNSPENFWNKIKEGWDTVSTQLLKLKETAGDKFQLNVGLILEDVNKKLCKKLRQLTGDKQMAGYSIARTLPKDFAGKYAKFSGTLQAVAKEMLKSGVEEVKELGQKLLDGTVTLGVFLMILIIAPFYAAGWATNKLMNAGIAFATVVEKFIQTAKTEVPEIWGEFKTGVKTGYDTTQQKPATEPSTTPTPSENVRILKFAEFVNEKKKMNKEEFLDMIGKGKKGKDKDKDKDGKKEKDKCDKCHKKMNKCECE